MTFLLYRYILISETRKTHHTKGVTDMTNKEKLELNRLGLIEEYKKLNSMILNMEINDRMFQISNILVTKYNMTYEEVESLEH